MSTSSLLPNVALNASRDDHQSGHNNYHHHTTNHHHHLSREFANLSMLNFGDRNPCINSLSNGNFTQDPEHNIHNSNILQENLYSNDHHHLQAGNGTNYTSGNDNNNSSYSSVNHLIVDPSSFEDQFNVGMRRSANMTETVPVPSSEHVAEIVGRQGCKIKSLRTQTNTYIKTPVRGAQPVFVVTGRREDVAKARQQILSAAEHFSSIRASRRNGVGGPATSTGSGTSSPTSVPGHITSQVRVPYKVVGLVVGPKGATIKRIQQTTSTYIVTPGRDKEPVFDVTGLPENVEKAKEEIEKHIASRTGTDNNSDLQIDDFQVNGIDSGYHDQSGDSSSANASTSSSYHYGTNIVNHHDNLPPLSSFSGNSGVPSAPLYQQMSSSSHLLMNQPPVSSAAPLKISEYNVLPFTHTSSFKSTNADYDIDEGFGTSGSAASAGSVYDPSALWNDPSAYGVQRSNSVSISAPRILPPGEDGPHPRTRRTNSDPLAAAFQKVDAAFSSASSTDSQGSISPVTGRRNPLQRDDCSVSQVNEPETGFVTCGHTEFCRNCAQDISQRELPRKKSSFCKPIPNGQLQIRSQN